MQLVPVLLAYMSAFVASANNVSHPEFNLFGGKVNVTLFLEHLVVRCGIGDSWPFSSLQNVKTVELIHCPLPNTSYAAELHALNVNTSVIQRLHLTDVDGDDMQLKSKQFEGLYIQQLRIDNRYGSIVVPSSDAFKHFSNMTVLNLVNAELPPLSKTSKLQRVEVDKGWVSGHYFSGCNELRELNISDTNLDLVPPHWLKICTQLEVLRVTWTVLSKTSLEKVLEGATHLKELVLKGCALELQTLPWDLLSNAEHLSRLELSNNLLNNIVLNKFKIQSLKLLDLMYCHITVLQGLPVSFEPQVEINMRGNDLTDVQLQAEDYEMLKKNNVTVNVTGAAVWLNCYDCQHGWLWLAVREKRLLIDAHCSEEVKLGDEDLQARKSAECELYPCTTAPRCKCRRLWSSGAVWAYCEGAELQTIPHEPGLQELHAAGNYIYKIDVEDLPDTLQLLDLSGNRVSLVEAAAAKKLFSDPGRRVFFAGNTIACVCDNQELLDAVYENRKRVEDYKNVTCASGEHAGEALSTVFPADLCASLLPVQLFSALAVLLALCLLLTALYCQYNHVIKVFLFTRGWCLNCVSEEELDADHPYDVFVSYSHEDAEIVTEMLIPGLERSPHSYKVCVHFRDWVPGVLITTQISRSVALSRRTIIVLSRNFVRSVWGLLEFRSAHISTLREGRARIIVVVLDNVIEDEDLDPELRGYLRANTYVRWGDPWFWNKLRYALPHRTSERVV